MPRNTPRAPLFFPITLVLVGIVILLNNYLVIDADIVSLWPLVLILIGLQVAWRGDLAPNWEAQSFGITRGSVESAALEISSGEIDVRLASLNRAGRLIAGQYTARSRPRLSVRNNHAMLTMRRGDTWIFSLADWEVGLAQDVPWSIVMSSYLGEFQADLRGLTLRQAHLATGISNIRVTAPDHITGNLHLRSTFGDLHLTLSAAIPTLIHVKASPFCRVIMPESPLEQDESGQYYATPSYDAANPCQHITLTATFGNIRLIALP